MRNILTFILFGLCFTACKNNNSKIFSKSIDETKIERIELVQVEHPMLGGHIKSTILDTLETKNFLLDFQDRKTEMVKFYSCYVIKIFYKNGELKSYRTNGHCMEKLKDTTMKGGPFTFNSKENLVTKYWHIEKENFCKIPEIDTDAFYDKIYRLPEVIEYSKILMKKNKRNLKVWSIDTVEIDNTKYALYNVGEDNGICLLTNFHFARELYDDKLLGFDIENDNVVSLEKWRKLNTK
jgi:hypothetical protein